MPTYQYTARAYRQALDPAAPWLLSFVAPAAELAAWAGVPRRSEQNRTGFQRIEDPKRIEKAEEYFKQPSNQSPTSLIVGLHGDSAGDQRITIKWDQQDESRTEQDGPRIDSGSRGCIVTIDLPDMDLDTAREVVKNQLAARLALVDSAAPPEDLEVAGDSSEARERAEPTNDSDTSDEDESAVSSDREDDSSISSDEEDEDEDVSDEELELGQSVLAELLKQLDDPAFLAVQENAESIQDLAKPATIIDGQHRLLGADLTERAIPFSVVAILDCPWPEQVFQFTVVNYTAKGIPDQFITANAALSLTKPELDSLKTRLVQANVKIKEYDLMRVVNFDDRSPFADRVNLTESRNPGLIGYKTMVQVANQWFDAKHQVFNTLLPRLYPDIQGKAKKSRRREQWKEGDWGEFFLAFWQEVYRAYATEPSHIPGKHLWDIGDSQLTVAVVLLEIQKAFLDNLNAQDEDYFDVAGPDVLDQLTEKVRARARKFVKFLPPDFFATKWKITSLNTGSGRIDLNTCIAALVNAKGKYAYASDRLIVGG